MIQGFIFSIGLLFGLCLPMEVFSKSAAEDAFYAVCSLQCHIDQMVSEHRQRALQHRIDFDEKDVARLWLKALKSPYALSVERAKKWYAIAKAKPRLRTFLKVQKLLSTIWEKSSCAHMGEVALAKKDGDTSHYYLTKDHWLKGALDSIFSSYKPLASLRQLKRAGFEVVSKRINPMYVVSHEKLPAYLLKLYLNSENKEKKLHTRWLVDRCKGAENIRNLIRRKKIRYFTVPDKWIYLLPGHEVLNDHNNAVLVVTDMQTTSFEETKWAWKNIITKAHLKELYCILSHGFASTYLHGNIPYCKDGTFACLDTEYPKRKLPLYKVSSYLSESMRPYWEKLIKKAGRVK